ncbi:MAG TPA: AraC family transcriptional regulator [Steroidobacteraceae bacterium]|nr:AraC family transcriptional regulator [Steroidobacteraceae bacterium]
MTLGQYDSPAVTPASLTHFMANRVLISSDDADLWGKLEAIQQLDPAVSGGIQGVVYGRRPHSRDVPITGLVESGYEEIHEVETGFCVHITDAVIGQDWRLTASSLGATLRLRLVFAGEAGYAARESHLSDESTRCSFIILPPGEMLTASFKGGTAYRYCSLSISRDYLVRTLALADDELPAVLPMYWARREAAMGHFGASKAALNQASRLFNIRSSPGWRDLTVRALSLELLSMLLRDWRAARSHLRAAIRITPAERARLIRIREQIDADPGAPLTLTGAAGRTRLSRNKLHYGFKQCFGVSLHEYRTERRMDMALKLLQETRLPISDVAARVGYDEPTNFTAAFKKHFASLPREVRTPSRRS